MKEVFHVAVTVGVALLLSGGGARAQTQEQLAAPTPEQLAIFAQLGPDGFASAPPLPALVRGTPAAIVGRVLGTDGFDHSGGYAHVTYRIAIDEVLFDRNAVGAPRLAAGTVVRLEQHGKGDFARRYFTGKLPPVEGGDTCLLFLEAMPTGVVLGGWSLHFRRVAGPVPAAETLGGASLAEAMATKPDWFGQGVRRVSTPRGTMPSWESLLAEVRRLAALPGRQR